MGADHLNGGRRDRPDCRDGLSVRPRRLDITRWSTATSVTSTVSYTPSSFRSYTTRGPRSPSKAMLLVRDIASGSRLARGRSQLIPRTQSRRPELRPISRRPSVTNSTSRSPTSGSVHIRTPSPLKRCVTSGLLGRMVTVATPLHPAHRMAGDAPASELADQRRVTPRSSRPSSRIRESRLCSARWRCSATVEGSSSALAAISSVEASRGTS